MESSAYDEFENKSEEQRKKLTLDQMLLICNCLREVRVAKFIALNFIDLKLETFLAWK